ncbi:MAG: TonB family protein [Massilia sp.]|nr:TonB family protein [Massilia sp.]
MPTDTAFDRPRHALSKIALVIALHALVLVAFMSSDRILSSRTPQTVMLLTLVPPKIAEPPPPPPPPPRPQRHKNMPRPSVREAAAPPLRDIEVVPRTEVVPTIVDNAIPVEVAGGQPEGTGTAGTGDMGEGVGGGAPIKVRAILDPANCERPLLPWDAERRKLTGHVILAVLIDVDGEITKARIARSSGEPILDRTALAGARTCHFVAATVDKVPVPSWELFRFSWSNR